MIGKSIAHYQVIAELGSGGMGVVYRAHDERLDRDVAIKALPEELSRDKVRLSRFEREAKVLASLNHSHIGAIYGLERHDGQSFLILELVEGETLAELIGRKPIDVPETLRLSCQIAEALAAAHDAGIVHRDLKPANIKINPEGQIKVLDFGLAKPAAESATTTESTQPTEYPATQLTHPGAVAGTAPYMSPEQARGQPVDGRTDVWAFGCVVFEMLTGRRTFGGPTHSDITAAILRGEPDWSKLPPTTTRTLRRVLALCLTKELKSRLRSMSDVGLFLAPPSPESSASGGFAGSDNNDVGGTGKQGTPPRRRWLLPAVATGLLAVGLLIGFLVPKLFEPDQNKEALHIPMAPPYGLKPSLGYGPSLAISPTGKHLAYVLETGTTTTLYLKGPDDLEARPLPGTNGARTPFFSPSSEWIGFFDDRDRKLKRVALGGGEPVAVADATSTSGAVWAADDTIVFTSTGGGILRVPAAGGEPQRITDSGAWPTLLPGGDVVLFTIREGRGSYEDASIVAMPLAGGEPKIILESAYYPHYALSGHLIFVQGQSILAAPFDPKALEITGPAVTVLENVWTSSWTGYSDFTFSDTGTLVYISGGPNASRASLVSVDREGRSTPLLKERRPYRVPRLSPDGQRVAITIADEQVDVWTYDLERRSLGRLTDSASWDAYPQWQPGMNSMAFASMRDGPPALYLKNLRRGTVERLFEVENANFPSSWSPDGKLLAYAEDNPQSGSDIWVYSLDSGSREAFLATPYSESHAEFSPDGRFIAYASDETGQQDEIYIRPYPEGNPRLKVSTAGGRVPRWGAGGKEIFYWVGGALMAVPLQTEPELTAGTPTKLFEGHYGYAYDSTPDGQSFLMVEEMADSDPPMRFNFVANWFERLKLVAGR